jgi:ring-1,2-phenylacetyl-CoA epoxidase subunit PaaC
MSTAASSSATSSSLRPVLDTPRAQVLLALADDALITGHRASHWTGVAPSLEEDLAFSTIAQDGINHADLWYQVLIGSDADDVRAGVDALGLGRAPEDYRHAVVCERPPRDFAYTLARHWVLTRFEAIRLDTLTRSTDAEVAAIAVKLTHELRYHREHADHWFHMLSGGGDDARQRFHAALAAVLPASLGLYEPVVGEQQAVADGLLPVGHPDLRELVEAETTPLLQAAGYGDLVLDGSATVPEADAGGRVGRHSEDFTVDVWPEMTQLYRAHPGARW